MLSSKHVLCIRGLSENDSESEIYSLLSKYGTLTHLEIIKPKDNKGKKNALAHYSDENQANFARVSLHNQKVGSNYLFVDYYDPYSKLFQGLYPTQIQIPQQMSASAKPGTNGTFPGEERNENYMNFLRDKKDFKTEKKIIKFTEVDNERKNEKTTLYTKKNLEKMISSSNNSRMPSQMMGPQQSSLPKEELFPNNNCLNSSPMVTQNYYINGTMNNQQNVYLKSQINFIHFLPFGVSQNAPTIEQIKQSYLEKNDFPKPSPIITNPAPSNTIASPPPDLISTLETQKNTATIAVKEKPEKKEDTAYKFIENHKEFYELIREHKLELDFKEVKNSAYMRKKLRRLYHRMLHKFLKTTHTSHIQKSLKRSFDAFENEGEICPPDHSSHKLAAFHLSHQEPLKIPLVLKEDNPETTELQSQICDQQTFVKEEVQDIPQKNSPQPIDICKIEPEKPMELEKENENVKLEVPVKQEEIEGKKEEKEEKKLLEEDLLKNKKIKNLLNFMMNGGDISHLYASYMKKKGMNAPN